MLFSEVIGHEAIKERLRVTARDGRVSHAQLFLGPRGSGKLALALAYAQYLNCDNPSDIDSCGVCSSCVKISKLIHPDLHFIFPVAPLKGIDDPVSKDFMAIWRNFVSDNKAYVSLSGWLSAMGIENKQAYIRTKDCDEIIKTLSLTSYEAGFKIMIIWMAERLYHAGAPKILKILEEPPDKTLFILIAEQHEELLSTIKSRTQLVKIPKIPDDLLLESLIINHQCEKEKAKQIIFLADGDYRAAIDYFNSGDDVDDLFNLFREWMLQCYFNNFLNINNFITGNISKLGRESLINLLTFGLKVVRDCFAVHYGMQNHIRADGAQLDSIVKLSKFINPGNITRFEEELNKAVFHVERNGNARAILLDLSLTVSQLMRQ